jgi:dihydroceramide fatty acyl 2-hydroxylase
MDVSPVGTRARREPSVWSTTFRRFDDGQIQIGPVAVVVKDWSRPQPGESRIFSNALLERMVVAGPLWPIALYVPAGIALIWYAARIGASTTAIAIEYASGLLVWSLIEYVTHRFLFHHAPVTRFGVAIQYLIHGVHHAYPDDSRRWMIPLGVTFPIAVALAAATWIVFGPSAMPGFAGFLHGYLTYDLVHHLIHERTNTTRVVRWLRMHHMQHHYGAPDRQFGVSSSMWDVVFRTIR